MDGIAEDIDDVRSGIADKNSTQISTTAERIQQLNKIDEVGEYLSLLSTM